MVFYYLFFQVECLENAWHILRRVYTDNAFMFEAKLRPCFKSMNEGTNPLPPNTTTPHVLPPVLCFHLFGKPWTTKEHQKALFIIFIISLLVSAMPAKSLNLGNREFELVWHQLA